MCQILAIRQVVSQQFFWHKGEGSSLGILHGHSETASERGWKRPVLHSGLSDGRLGQLLFH